MAEDPKDEAVEGAPTGNYKFTGMKNDWDKTAEAHTTDKVVVRRGESVDLNEAQVAELKSMGLVLRKTGDASGDDDEGEGDGPKQSVVETPAQQQRVQVASGAQHPAAAPKKDNTPAARGSGS